MEVCGGNTQCIFSLSNVCAGCKQYCTAICKLEIFEPIRTEGAARREMARVQGATRSGCNESRLQRAQELHSSRAHLHVTCSILHHDQSNAPLHFGAAFKRRNRSTIPLPVDYPARVAHLFAQPHPRMHLCELPSSPLTISLHLSGALLGVHSLHSLLCHKLRS